MRLDPAKLKELWGDVQRGVEGARNALVEYMWPLAKYWGMTRDPDVGGEAAVKLIERIDAYRGEAEGLCAFVKARIRGERAHILEREGKLPIPLGSLCNPRDDDHDPMAFPTSGDDPVEHAMLNEEMSALMDGLAPNEQLLFRLIMQGCTQKEAGEAAGFTPMQVQRVIARVREST